MEEEKKEGKLSAETVWFMIGTALFFDFLQFLFTFIFMGWLVGIFAGLTFWFWFRGHGISFKKASRWGSFAFTYLIEMLPFISAIPAWTVEVSYIALTNKLQEVVPGANITKLDLNKKPSNVASFKPRAAGNQPSPNRTSTEQHEKAA